MDRFTQEDVDEVTVTSRTQGIPHRSFSGGEEVTLSRVEEEIVNESETRLLYEFTNSEVAFTISHIGVAQALQNDELSVDR